MKSLKRIIITVLVFSLSFFSLAGCGALKSEPGSAQSGSTAQDEETTQSKKQAAGKKYDNVSAEIKLSGASAKVEGTGAEADGGTVIIKKGGAYSISGKLTGGGIVVDAGDEDVTLILSGAEITSSDSSAVNVYKAGTVTLEVSDGTENVMSDAESYVYDGSYSDKTNEEPSACIFSKSDLIITGGGKLRVNGNSGNAVKSKDYLTVENTLLTIECENNALTGNDGVSVNGAEIDITAKGDGIHSNTDVEINSGKITVKSDDDAIHADSSLTVNGGEMNLTAHEGLEATLVTVNDGTVVINASDDGINAAQKTDGVTPAVEINGGDITITMGAGDTDAIDSNGNIIINGGKLTITAQSGFDYDGKAELNGGEVYLNGEKLSEITNQFGGGMRGFGSRDAANRPADENGEFFRDGTPPTDENGEPIEGKTPPADGNGGFPGGKTPPTDEDGNFIRGSRRGFPGESGNNTAASASDSQSA